MSNKPNGHVDHILNNGSDSAALHIAANRSVVFAQTLLTDDTQQIVGEQSGMKHQIIRRKLSGWQPLQVQIRLDFAVKLLACAVISI